MYGVFYLWFYIFSYSYLVTKTRKPIILQKKFFKNASAFLYLKSNDLLGPSLNAIFPLSLSLSFADTPKSRFRKSPNRLVLSWHHPFYPLNDLHHKKDDLRYVEFINQLLLLDINAEILFVRFRLPVKNFWGTFSLIFLFSSRLN